MSGQPEVYFKPEVLILDVDGVMTDGASYYTAEGKLMKKFGPDDHDALSLLKPYVPIHFVSGDKRGFEITRARIETDMKMPLHLVSTVRRIDWIRERWNPERVVYMGDGIFDHYVFRAVGYSIAPHNADVTAKRMANYITSRSGGDRAVAEACLHLLEQFFKKYDIDTLPDENIKFSGKW